MNNITCWLYVAAFILTLVAATGRVQLWIPLLLVVIGLLMGCFAR